MRRVLEESVDIDEERAGPFLSNGGEGRVDFALVLGANHNHPLPDVASRILHVFGIALGHRIGRVDEESDGRRLRHEFAQQFKALGTQGAGIKAYAGSIAARSIHARDEPEPDRVAPVRKCDRYCRSGGLGGARYARSSNRGQDRYRETDQIECQRKKAIVLTGCRKTAFDDSVLAFCKSLLTQSVAEARQLLCIQFR